MTDRMRRATLALLLGGGVGLLGLSTGGLASMDDALRAAEAATKPPCERPVLPGPEV